MESIWHELTPEMIFKCVEATLGESLTNVCIRRNSYINRVYELEKEDNTRLIVKFYRPGRWSKETILAEHEFLAKLRGNDLSIITPLAVNKETLFQNGQYYFSVFPKKWGRPMDEFDQEGWQTIGRLIAKIHQVGEKLTDAKRLTWRPEVVTKNHLKTIVETGFILPDFIPALKTVVEQLIGKSEPLFDRETKILLHGDCHKGNFISRPGEGIYIIDFDDCALGPAVQDLWLILPDKPDYAPNETAWLLKGYRTFRDFNDDSWDLVPALRGMRIVHYAAWLAVQSKENDFGRNFPETGTPRYWNTLIKELQVIVSEEL
ncbi:MAG: serine/threonine protein kinase [Candidatus Margulisbacteria bacterium]|nr:serine/threonine protein kinase [Candidatus Margulisiibacteriota bacterium]MBU1616741.1 serine/threonine protein kinase [Candidatus Margulisiibacteriota bacterium]